jgi:hypothetical protein
MAPKIARLPWRAHMIRELSDQAGAGWIQCDADWCIRRETESNAVDCVPWCWKAKSGRSIRIGRWGGSRWPQTKAKCTSRVVRVSESRVQCAGSIDNGVVGRMPPDGPPVSSAIRIADTEVCVLVAGAEADGEMRCECSGRGGKSGRIVSVNHEWRAVDKASDSGARRVSKRFAVGSEMSMDDWAERISKSRRLRRVGCIRVMAAWSSASQESSGGRVAERGSTPPGAPGRNENPHVLQCVARASSWCHMLCPVPPLPCLCWESGTILREILLS